MKKGQIFEIKIEDMTDEGAGIGKADGYPLFVKDAVPGDVIRAELIKDKKTYGYGRLLEVCEASPDRIDPKCPIARPCGGCQLQALSYEAQLVFKENKVKAALKRIGGVTFDETEPVISMKDPWHYRNKAEYPVRKGKDGRILIGFYAGRTHSVIECENCLIGQEADAQVLGAVKRWMNEFGIEPYDEEAGTGTVRHVMIRTSFASGEQMVCLVVNTKKLPFANELSRLLPKTVTSFSYSVNLKKTNVIMGDRTVPVFGEAFLEDVICGVRYRISPRAFYQVNPAQTEKLYAKALEYAGLSGNETVWDLYCGIGTISLIMAKKAKKVYGVEIIPEAVKNAQENAVLNDINNAEFFTGRAEDVLPEHFAKTGEKADVIVVDPPRKGCDGSLLHTIALMAPKRLVYVSCNPATLARDVSIMREFGYEVKKVQPVDMFPWTGHVETVVQLVNIGAKPDYTVRLEVDVDEFYKTVGEEKRHFVKPDQKNKEDK